MIDRPSEVLFALKPMEANICIVWGHLCLKTISIKLEVKFVSEYLCKWVAHFDIHNFLGTIVLIRSTSPNEGTGF